MISFITAGNENTKIYQKLKIILCAALLLHSWGKSSAAQDWSQWRGPTRDGVIPAADVPTAWPDSLRRLWRVEIGEGFSSPIVSRGRVFVHSRRDPEEIVMALEATSGQVIWQQKYLAKFEKNRYASRMAKGPNATPLLVENRLFTLGVTGVFKAWDTATGREIWSKDFSKTVDASKLFCGTSASPLWLDGLVVVQVGSDIHGGQIIAFDPATGAAKWTWQGQGPGYASPIVIQPNGKSQVVTLTDSSIIGLEAKSGSQLWEVSFLDEWHENIVTPIWTGAHLIVSGVRQGTHAFTLQQRNGQWQASAVWKNAEVAMYMSSPVYGDGLIYGHSTKQKGQFVALDAKTGAVRWASEGREGPHASVLLAPRHLIYLTNGSDLIVARRNTAKLEIERRYDVAAAETWAMPVFLGTDIFVRDATGLMRLTYHQN